MYRNVYYDARNGLYKLFTWDSDGERVVLDCSYSPYLYVESRTESDARSLYGTDLKKKYFRTNGDRRKFATTGGIKRLFENLSCDQQFLMDMYWTFFERLADDSTMEKN